ncbi:hypothetical protein LCGC14_2150680, partial [marine sediment metagenome]
MDEIPIPIWGCEHIESVMMIKTAIATFNKRVNRQGAIAQIFDQL